MLGALAARTGRLALQRRNPVTVAKRFGSSGGAGDPKYNYFKAPHVDPFYKRAGEVMSTVMWLWIFYRAKEDGLTVFLGLHPWDLHHDDEHDDHHDENHHHVAAWAKEIGETPKLMEH